MREHSFMGGGGGRGGGDSVVYNWPLLQYILVDIACVASVSLRLGSKERPRNGILPARNWDESKIRKKGWGRGRKETLADKPLDFEKLRTPVNGPRD